MVFAKPETFGIEALYSNIFKRIYYSFTTRYCCKICYISKKPFVDLKIFSS